jgi:hypothetical protein
MAQEPSPVSYLTVLDSSGENTGLVVECWVYNGKHVRQVRSWGTGTDYTPVISPAKLAEWLTARDYTTTG